MFARIAALAALQTTCCAAGAVLAAPAEQRVAVTYQEGEHVPTRGAIDRAEAAGRAARLCSGDWRYGRALRRRIAARALPFLPLRPCERIGRTIDRSWALWLTA